MLRCPACGKLGGEFKDLPEKDKIALEKIKKTLPAILKANHSCNGHSGRPLTVVQASMEDVQRATRLSDNKVVSEYVSAHVSLACETCGTVIHRNLSQDIIPDVDNDGLKDYTKHKC